MHKSRNPRPSRPSGNLPHTRPSSARPGPPRQPPVHESFRIAGLAAVSAVFARDPDRIERLFFDARLKAKVGAICTMLAERKRPYRLVEPEELAKVAGTAMHGGVVAVTRPRPVSVFDPQAKDWRGPLVILDGVGIPHNLGAIVRTMAFFGLRKLLVTDHPGQALPSEAAYRVAEGGFEWVQVQRLLRPASTLKQLRDSHRVVATALGQGKPLEPGALSGGARPTALILGNEEEGVPTATLQACDAVVTIPGSGAVQSLNVAATAAILAHALSCWSGA
jgi:TrmH RNA methyltransferase